MMFICGPICSGKTTYGRILSEEIGTDFIEVSDIVKEITHSSKREDLQNTAYLDQQIITRLQSVDEYSIVVGVRQKSILQAFPNSRLMWLEVPYSERLQCYLDREDTKDTLTEKAFQLAEKKDNDLGLQEVRDYILNRSLS